MALPARTLPPGGSRIRFRRKLAGEPLDPGKYVATATATDAAGHGSPEATARFRVKR